MFIEFPFLMYAASTWRPVAFVGVIAAVIAWCVWCDRRRKA
jgi:hypothetical protein